MNKEFELRPNIRQTLKRFLVGHAPTFVILLIALIILNKLPFDTDNNFPFNEIQGKFIPLLLIWLLVFLGGYIGWFIWNYLNYWKIDSKGIFVRRFILKSKLFEWGVIEAVSGDSGSVKILSDNWKIKARIHFIDFESYKVLLNYLAYFKYSTLDPARRPSGSDWKPIG